MNDAQTAPLKPAPGETLVTLEIPESLAKRIEAAGLTPDQAALLVAQELFERSSTPKVSNGGPVILNLAHSWLGSFAPRLAMRPQRRADGFDLLAVA